MKTLKMIRNSLLTGVCVGLLAGCSWLEDWPPKGSEMARKTAPKPPESKIMQTSGGTWITPSGNNAGTGEAASAKGINIDQASADRIAKLEATVDQLSNDLKMIMPALTKLASAQGSIQNNLANIEPAAGGSGMAQGFNDQYGKAPVPITGQNQQNQRNQQQNNAPKPGTVAWYEQQEQAKRQGGQKVNQQSNQFQNNNQNQNNAPSKWLSNSPPVQQYQQQAQQQVASYQPPPVQQQAQQQIASVQPVNYGGNAMGSSGNAVTNVRFGEHADKTRLVLDTSDKVSFSYNMDNNENILMIQLPGTGWQGAQQMQIHNSPLVSSYSVIPDNQGGSQLVMQLRGPARVLWAQALAPGGPQGHRVVFDLAGI